MQPRITSKICGQCGKKGLSSNVPCTDCNMVFYCRQGGLLLQQIIVNLFIECLMLHRDAHRKFCLEIKYRNRAPEMLEEELKSSKNQTPAKREYSPKSQPVKQTKEVTKKLNLSISHQGKKT
jgi:hypothetical protein